jgi:hypothetical protein
VKKDFHLEIQFKGGKCKGAAGGENPVARNRRTNFWVVLQQVASPTDWMYNRKLYALYKEYWARVYALYMARTYASYKSYKVRTYAPARLQRAQVYTQESLDGCVCKHCIGGTGCIQIVQGHLGTVQQKVSSGPELPGLLYLYFSSVGHFPNKGALVSLESLLMKI